MSADHLSSLIIISSWIGVWRRDQRKEMTTRFFVAALLALGKGPLWTGCTRPATGQNKKHWRHNDLKLAERRRRSAVMIFRRTRITAQMNVRGHYPPPTTRPLMMTGQHLHPRRRGSRNQTSLSKTQSFSIARGNVGILLRSHLSIKEGFEANGLISLNLWQSAIILDLEHYRNWHLFHHMATLWLL